MQYFVLKPIELPETWLSPRVVMRPVDQALGAVTAESVKAAVDVPNYTCALRDGWAVCSTDDPCRRIARLGSTANGSIPAPLSTEQAVWVNTGGVLPEGADAVIASLNELDREAFRAAANHGDNVELKGADWRSGEEILTAGTRIGAREMALLYESGTNAVRIWATPSVAIIATGSEMVDTATPLITGLRRCSNLSYVQALMHRIGVTSLKREVIADDEEALSAALTRLDAECDLIITVGGTGRGTRDYTRRAIKLARGTLFSDSTANASPFVLGRLPHAAIIGLPGNPLGTMMIVQKLLLERIQRAYHLPETAQQICSAIITDDIEAGHKGELCVALSADDGKLFATPVKKGTGRMRLFETAAGTVRLSGEALIAGSCVTVEVFRN